MNLDFAIFASHAVVQPNGLFSVLEGGMEWIQAKSLPVTYPNLMIVARFSFAPEECGKEYTCEVTVTAPSGNVLTPGHSLVFTPNLHALRPAAHSTFIGLFRYDRFTIDEVGTHVFSFFIGNNCLGSVALDALLLE